MIASPATGPAARRIPLETVVLGVDPGTAVTGYGVVRRGADGAVSLLECGVVRTRPGGELADRLREIYEGLTEVIARTQPGVLAVEGVFFAKNVRSAVVLGHARGVALLAGAMHGLRVTEYPPAEVKAAVVGAGRATKDQVGLMVQRHLKLRAVPKPHDAADGVAVALCHCFRGFGPAAPALAPVSIATLAAAMGARR